MKKKDVSRSPSQLPSHHRSDPDATPLRERQPLPPPSQPPARTVRKSHLSAERQWLVETMQRIGFGRIKKLIILRGQPQADPPPRLYRDLRVSGPNPLRRESRLRDFVLKQRVVDFFEQLDHLHNGTIAWLEVRDGLPYEMTLEERVRA
jgi:hypothetical protein